MSRVEKQQQLEFVGDLAAEQLDHFEPRERARLYEALSLVYTGEKSETCALAALAIRTAEQHQLKFRELLKS